VRRAAWGVAAAAVFGGLVVLPGVGRYAWLWREARTLPVPGGAAVERRSVNVVRWEPWPRGQPPFAVDVVTSLSFEEADRLIREGGAAGGWEIGRRTAAQPLHPMNLRAWETRFRRKAGADAGGARAYILVGPRRWVRAALFDAGAERWILFDADFDEPPEGLRRVGL
jgi:hypothetical protein